MSRLKKLMDLIRIRSTAFVGKNLADTWSITIEEAPNLARFHFVLSGQTYVEHHADAHPVLVRAGEIALFPHGCAHSYKDQPRRPREKTSKLPDFEYGPYFHNFDPIANQTHLLCGFFEFSPETPPAISGILPSLIVAPIVDPANPGEGSAVLDHLKEELKSGDPSVSALNRLTEILCIQAIETWLRNTGVENLDLRVLADPQTSEVLEHIHNSPGANWTVERLAEIYGRSRTSFSTQFKRATGFAPMEYVRRRRINLACRLLEEGAMSLDEIAFMCGYADTNAFNRAFRRETGVSPGAYKRNAA